MQRKSLIGFWSEHRFLVGFISGAAVISCLGGIILRYPILLSKDSQGSYALGQQLGKNFSKSKTEVSAFALTGGVLDALNGSSRISEDDQREAIFHLQNEAQERRKISSPPPQEGSSFPPRPNPDFHKTPSGISYRLFSKGNRVSPPQPLGSSSASNHSVTFHYQLNDKNGKILFRTEGQQSIRLNWTALPNDIQFLFRQLNPGEKFEIFPDPAQVAVLQGILPKISGLESEVSSIEIKLIKDSISE